MQSFSKANYLYERDISARNKHDHDFLCIWWLLKEPFVLWQDGLSNRQIRTECGLVSSERKPHPWLLLVESNI